MRRPAAVLVGVALLLAGCASGSGDDVTVAAAASLGRAFRALDGAAAGAGFDVAVSLAGSPAVVEQVRQGAPVDVVMLADLAMFEPLVRDGLVDAGPVPFALNWLALAVSEDARTVPRSVDELARADVRVVMAAEGVPAGDLARRHLADVGLLESVLERVVSFEPDVEAVVAKLALGEADAGFVFVTDLATEGLRAVGEPLPVAALYAVALVADAPHPETARRFVRWLGSGEAEKVLADLGFEPPGMPH